MKRKFIEIFVLLILCIGINIFLYQYVQPIKSIEIIFDSDVETDIKDDIQVFWSTTTEFTENQSMIFSKKSEEDIMNISCVLPSNINYLRIDFGTGNNRAKLRNIKVLLDNMLIHVDSSDIYIIQQNQVEILGITEDYISVNTQLGDPFIILDVAKMGWKESCDNKITSLNRNYKILSCVYLNILVLLAWLFRRKLYNYLKKIADNFSLILDLAVNDFKTRFVGTVIGTVWAFVQPIVTILVYWFVFQVGFRTGNSENTQVPYALWLSTGLIPWFFFSEAWNSATNSLNEYNYLVKKVVFNISIIPSVKIVSALFVHGFFVILLLAMYLVNGVPPSLYWIQVIYYSFSMFVLILALTYITSSLVIFFKDISQIIAVLMQVGVWLTPIMWNIEMIPVKMRWIFELNPMYYITNGYRQALIYNEWAWNNVMLNIYFWTVTTVLLILGQKIFKKLKPHFADVL